MDTKLSPTPISPPVVSLLNAAKPVSKWIWVGRGIAILLVGLAVGFTLGKRFYSTPVVLPTPTPSPFESDSLTEQEGDLNREQTGSAATANQVPDGNLANWKTYTNTKYGYSIKYPPTLTPLETPGDIYLHQVEFKGPEETYLSGIIVEVRNLTNLEEEVAYRKWRVVGHITDKLDSEVPISISGIPGKRLNYASGQKQFSTIIVPYQKLVYTIEAESDLLDLILSTFRFTN